ncbi:unnamed protein product [Moneuplotes crassus]|uniref:DBF4-type domain-containing protein n=1 Tax=Euplotes crassus TaxID=5936 RepID=A0AAD1TZV8_EUPCR|nr:unnamed protein product [Moneuplotes crassus]
MQKSQRLIEDLKESKTRLMQRFDFKDMTFFIYLPNFDSKFRKDLSKRIEEYGGQIALIPKAGNILAIVSDNLVEEIIERNCKIPLRNNSRIQSGKNATDFSDLKSQNSYIDPQGLTDKVLYKRFIDDSKSFIKNREEISHQKFDEMRQKAIPMIKVRDLFSVLDYYDSFTKFKWHSKRDDCRLLRSVINGKGCFIVTSGKIFMKLRRRMEFHQFSYNHQTHKFEVPQLSLDAPQGTSIFQTPAEYKETKKNSHEIERRHLAKVEKFRKKCVVTKEPMNKHMRDCPKTRIIEPKPKKDNFFCCVCNDDYNDYISHIGTNQHKLSSYADNLKEYYEKIDEINEELNSQVNHGLPSENSEIDESPRVVDSQDLVLETPERKNIQDRLTRMDKILDNLMQEKLNKPKKSTTLVMNPPSKRVFNYQEIEEEERCYTAKFIEKQESEEANQSMICQHPSELDKASLSKINYMNQNLGESIPQDQEVSMNIVQNPMKESPPKHLSLESDLSENHESYITPQKRKKITEYEEEKAPEPLEKNNEDKENKTPNFLKNKEAILDLRDSQRKRSLEKVIKNSFKKDIKIGGSKAKLIPVKDCDSILACDSILKKSKLELVGIIVAGKNSSSESSSAKKRECKTTNKNLERALEKLFHK